MKSSLKREKELSYKLLSDARAKKEGYDSHATRRTLSNSVTALFPTFTPYGWQIDLAEALTLGLDATIIAYAASTKTHSWATSFLLDETRNKICLVISPLNELEADHHARFFTEKFKIPAVVVNYNTWRAQENSIRNERLYRIVLTSPEMCLDNSGFSALLKDPQWSCSILLMVVNEAHHIEQWDTEFRRRYVTFDTLRSFIPRGALVLTTSATMPPTTLEHVRTTLGMDAGKLFHLNLGNDRHNIVPLVWPMEGGAPNLAALDFVVRGRDRPLRTIIYFNKLLAMRACIYPRKILPPKQTHKIDVFHANRGPRTKKAVMKDFRVGKILVLCAMEIVGMGTGIPDVDDAQFMAPDSLSVWIQRAGCAVRDGRPARAILLAEPLVFEEPPVKSSKVQKRLRDVLKGDEERRRAFRTTSDRAGNSASDPERDDGDDNSSQDNSTNGWEEFDADAAYQTKHIDPEMRRWILARDCRRIISDEFFNNPAHHKAHPLDLCYDNWIRKKNCGDRFESVYDLISFLDTSCGRSPISRPADDNSDLEPTTLAKDWGNLCVGNHLAIRRRVLEDWRYDCWKNYRLCTWGVVGVMPDPILSLLASSIKIEAFDDLLEAIPNWGYASKYGHEVLSLLKDADHRHQLESPI